MCNSKKTLSDYSPIVSVNKTSENKTVRLCCVVQNELSTLGHNIETEFL